MGPSYGGAACVCSSPVVIRTLLDSKMGWSTAWKAPSSMNPQLYGSGTLGSSLSHQIYDRLLTVNPLSQRLEGALASEWTISPDGLTYTTFTLRKGCNFTGSTGLRHLGEFNADDVLFSFNHIRFPYHPFHDISGGRYPFFENSGFSQQMLRSVNSRPNKFNLYSRRQMPHSWPLWPVTMP